MTRGVHDSPVLLPSSPKCQDYRHMPQSQMYLPYLNTMVTFQFWNLQHVGTFSKGVLLDQVVPVSLSLNFGGYGLTYILVQLTGWIILSHVQLCLTSLAMPTIITHMCIVQQNPHTLFCCWVLKQALKYRRLVLNF